MPGAVIVGFYGKLPSRGDFVRSGLPRDFTDRWDDWLQSVMAGSRSLMGDAWLPAFLEAPVWRFALPRGLCGERAALGVMLPSVDKAGRYFPLTFAALPPDDDALGVRGNGVMPGDGPASTSWPAPASPDVDAGPSPGMTWRGKRVGPGDSIAAPCADDAWLDRCEAAGRAGLEQDASPEQIAGMLTAPELVGTATDHAEWWTEGSPRVPPTRLTRSRMPDAATFASMLGASPIPGEAVRDVPGETPWNPTP